MTARTIRLGWLALLVLASSAGGQTTQPATTASAPAVQAVVWTIDGAGRSGALAGLDAQGAHLRVDGQALTVPAAELLEIRFAPDVPDLLARTDTAVVITARDGRLAAEGLSFADGVLGFRTPGLGELRIPVEQVRAVLLPGGRTSARDLLERFGKLTLPVRAQDYLVIQSGQGEFIPTGGVVRSIAQGRIEFAYEEQDRNVELSRVSILRFAQTGQAPAPPPGQAVLVDGSRLAFHAAVLGPDGRMHLSGTCAGDQPVPIARLAGLVLRNENLVYLSDLEPASVEQAGTFETSFPFRRDAAFSGKPLQLGGQTYKRGLALHSRCRLTYALDGAYRTFAALAGISDEVRPAGHATLTILGDDKPLLPTTELTGQDEPIPVRLDVAGVKTLTILVDFGEALDVADHVLLTEAKLTK